jgi:hypothetical protein
VTRESSGERLGQEPVLEGLKKHSYTVSFLKANLLALVTGLLPVVPLVWIFIAIWGAERLFTGLSWLEIATLALSLPVGIVLHELLHAAGWHFFGQVPREAIKFGFKVEYLTPYAHSTQTMSASAYRLGGLLPGLVLGLLPGLLALATGSALLMFIGVIFTFAAGGDLLIFWLLRSVPAEAPVQDHPSEVGCYVYLPADPT